MAAVLAVAPVANPEPATKTFQRDAIIAPFAVPQAEIIVVYPEPIIEEPEEIPELHLTATSSPKEVASSTPQTTKELIYEYSKRYGADVTLINYIAKCESNFNPKAHNRRDPNGGSKGIFQFQERTFYHAAKAVGIEDPDIWNVEQQVEAAAYLISKGYAYLWTCVRGRAIL